MYSLSAVVPVEAVARTVNVDVVFEPTADAVPEITPELFIDKPLGKLPD